MKLSELHTGDKATIVKVAGHGGFRKRIIEMGFIRGKQVEVLLNAPLEDPVKYRLMGYEVSLRRSEAQLIEVYKDDSEDRRLSPVPSPTRREGKCADDDRKECVNTDTPISIREGQTVSVALVGNPNCGKTSLFNYVSGAHERVGNYSGVTVDAKEGEATIDGHHLTITDLPGTYSLSAYSPEELYVRRHIIDETPDVIINVVDASNLERNLYLTTQLIDMDVRMVVALNMFDETERRGDHLDISQLSRLFGVPMVPTVFTTGKGVEELFRTAIRVSEEETLYRHIHINHGHEIEHGITEIQEHLKLETDLRQRYSTRYLAIKLLEHDSETETYVGTLPDADEIFTHRDTAARRVKEETDTDSETAIMDAKYGFINGALKEAGYSMGTHHDNYATTHRIDRIVTNRWAGFPLFIAMLLLMFTTTFTLGQYPMDWIEAAVAWVGEQVSTTLPDGPVKDLILDGVIGGVGAVIVFLPQILILYLFISYMEDSGYMARAAFIMDRLMHKMGLHGKSFIPLIMGFGCNVPAVMATRTIESRRSRLVTMLILPMMSCSARLPIYIMVAGTFFATRYQPLVMLSLYFFGIVMAIVMSRIFSRFLVKGEDTPFVMELPPYRFPTWRAIGRHTWEKGRQYLKKMGGIILVASIIVWALGYFPHNDQLNEQEQQEQSYIGQIGKQIEPLFRAQGFDWRLDVAIISGVGAKEIVASTMGVLYSGSSEVAENAELSDNPELSKQQSSLRSQMQTSGITPLTAYAFLVFVLLYFPCIATIAAVKGETGSWAWAAFTALYTTGVAWVMSALVYQLGRLFL